MLGGFIEMNSECSKCANYHMNCVITNISEKYCGCKCHRENKNV